MNNQDNNREKLLADITALALGQTDQKESQRIEAEIKRDPEAKQWFAEADAIGQLIRQSSEVNDGDRSTELRSMIERELESANGKVDLASDPKSKPSATSNGRQWMIWLAALSACIVIGCFVIYSQDFGRPTGIAEGNQDEIRPESRRDDFRYQQVGEGPKESLEEMESFDSRTESIVDMEVDMPEDGDSLVPGSLEQSGGSSAVQGGKSGRQSQGNIRDYLDSANNRIQKVDQSGQENNDKFANDLGARGLESKLGSANSVREMEKAESANEQIILNDSPVDELSKTADLAGESGSLDQLGGSKPSASKEMKKLEEWKSNVEKRKKFQSEADRNRAPSAFFVEPTPTGDDSQRARRRGGNGDGGFGGGGFGGGGGGRGMDMDIDGIALNGGMHLVEGQGLIPENEPTTRFGAPANSTASRENLFSVADGKYFRRSEGGFYYYLGDDFDPTKYDEETVRRKIREIQLGQEQYQQLPENVFRRPIREYAKSTFSIDVDSASYANIRRMINAGQRPHPAAVRIEEMVNYFEYEYQAPDDEKPFAVNMELATCPWNAHHQLLRVGVKAKEVHREERPNSNIVFLVDVSGSMSDQNKLPLLKSGLHMMIDRMGESDRISIVTYSGEAGVALEPTSGEKKKVLHEAIDRLKSGGSTNGSAGIELAYQMAERHFQDEGVNRVILATDGDLNVGITDDDALVKLIKEKAASKVFLSVFGFGTGNLKDAKLEKLADNGNGLYAYIDSTREAHRMLVDQMSGTLITVAKDLKLQLEFNPAEVTAYRLIGYENRVMANADFHNDKKDGGDIGAGHTVTALYEIVPAGAVGGETLSAEQPLELKYQSQEKEEADAKPAEDELKLKDAAKSGELLTLWLNYKQPESDERETDQQFTIAAGPKSFESASDDFQFAASVAAFGLILRNSKFKGTSSLEMVERIATRNLGDDQSGYRAEFIDLVRKVK